MRRTARWLFLTDAVTPRSGSDGPAIDATQVSWRVVAANNRPLGRSTATYDSFAACAEAAARIHERTAELVSTVDFDARTSTWGWTVAFDGGAAVGICVHRYRRRLECVRALEQFLSSVAAIPPMGTSLRHLGPYGLAEYHPRPEDRSARPMDAPFVALPT
jgi:hypothetical protein